MGKYSPPRKGFFFGSFYLVLAVSLFIWGTGCTGTEKNSSETHSEIPLSANSPDLFPVTIFDSNGSEIVFEEPPSRIIAMDSSVVEILYAMGEGHRLAGTHDFVSYPPESLVIPRVGDAFNLNLEALLELDPDLVFLFSPGAIPDLERLGIKTLYLNDLQQDLKGIPKSIRLWGSIVGNPEASSRLALEFEGKIAEIESKMEGVTSNQSVFQDEGELWTPGPGTLIGSVFSLLRLTNIAFDISGYAQLSPEIIVERNPDIIISSYGDRISTNPAFSEVNAVKSHRVFVPQGDILSVPGPRYASGVEELAIWIYPELFKPSEEP